MRSDVRLLWGLLALFCLRVLGQAIVAVSPVSFLPPMEDWFSGVISYPILLASQLLIIALLAKICLDLTRGDGYFALPRPGLGAFLTVFGCAYLAIMVIRYILRMSLSPRERWWGGAIPIFFHWVLASYVLILARYHKQGPIRRKLAIAAPIAIGMILWIAWQLAPWALGRTLGFRPGEFAVRTEHVEMKTSDGVALGADVYHPVHAGKTPAILVRLPLPKNPTYRLLVDTIGRMWAARGYTAVIQSTRGRYGSGGEYYPLSGERRDGLETLQWLASQSWFDGRLGAWGGSAFGHTAWMLADQSHPGPTAMMIWEASSDFHQMFYPDGAFALESATVWALRSKGAYDEPPSSQALDRIFRRGTAPQSPAAFFEDWRKHPDHDEYWSRIDGTVTAERVAPALLLMAGWFDPFLPSQLQDFERAPNARLIIGPWAHAESASLPGGIAPRNFRLESLAPTVSWFDKFLHPPGAVPGHFPAVRLYVMGSNAWREEERWPLARAVDTPYYLVDGGGLRATPSSRSGKPAVFRPAVFRYDPRDPTPSTGGAVLGPRAGMALQNAIEARSDVLSYTTAPLEKDTEVTGPVRLVLHAATTAKNTDFAATLVDVHPDGSAYNVCDGILRRDYGPGVNRVEIALGPTSMVFLKGHRIRLDVSSGAYPKYDRNPSAAEQTIYYGGDTASYLLLPIVPGV